MCVIVYKPAGCPMPANEVLQACWAANKDGAGMMLPHDGRVLIRKGFMEWGAFEAALAEAADSYACREIGRASCRERV